MEAHLVRCAILVAAIASLGAGYRTNNFVVNAPTADMAEQIGRAAEKYRRELALDWLGHEMPNWRQPCPITAQVGDHLGAGGATSFVFEHGEVFGWRMTIQGSSVRILDSVLPHEVTHTVFATHFRQPLPRWADEGACTTVEHSSERNKQQAMLIDFLRTGRGIAFSRMFVMKEYPHDVMPLYSQGYSVARYLVAQGDKHKFLEFLADGLRDENWPRAVRQHYGISDLAALQNDWLAWVRKGSPALDAKDGPALVAVANPEPSDARVRPQANLIYRGRNQEADQPGPSDSKDTRASDGQSIYQLAAISQDSFESGGPQDKSWHAPRRSSTASLAAATPDLARADRAGEEADPSSAPQAPYEVTRPQAVQRSRQVILEWSSPRRETESGSSAGPGPIGAN
ncbi:MAG: hypothetical protein HY288_13560 [Planctomycetia bacterium]|nr:hypothetical protein [Planctomycetia bacterium]